MDTCRVKVQKLERQFSLSLPSGKAVEIYLRDGVNEKGKPASIIRIEGKDGSLSRGEIEETKQFIKRKLEAFRSMIRDEFENWSLAQNNLKFSRRWFETVERNAVIMSNAQSIGDLWTHKPVNPEALRSQKRIADAILRHARKGKRALQAQNRTLAQSPGTQVVQLLARFLSEPDRWRGRYNLEQAREGGKKKGDNTKDQRDDWLRKADE